MPLFAVFVWFDARFPKLNPFLGFPRNAHEILADPAGFFKVLKRGARSRGRRQRAQAIGSRRTQS
jgi:hypothetical protein